MIIPRNRQKFNLQKGKSRMSHLPAENSPMAARSMNGYYPAFPFPLPLLLDGATGTAMIRAGMPAGVCPEKWILEHPEPLIRLQKRYLSAGSDAVLSPTFGANRTLLSRYSLADETISMNASLAALSRKAAGNALVGGDLSPTGAYLYPSGSTDFDELVSIYAEQAAALSSFVDFFMIETNMDLACTRAAVLGVRKASKKPTFVTMTVTNAGMTMSGDTPQACLLTLSELGISAFGLNCSTGPSEMSRHITPLLPLSLALGIPLIAKPNAGPQPSRAESPAAFADACEKMLSCGVGILGGCCGTDERHIAALKTLVDRWDGETFPSGISLPDTAMMASNARQIVPIQRDSLPAPLVPSEDFPNNAAEMADRHGFLYIRMDSRAQADTVLEEAPFLPVPLCLCGNADAIAFFRKRFCGKAPVIEVLS